MGFENNITFFYQNSSVDIVIGVGCRSKAATIDGVLRDLCEKKLTCEKLSIHIEKQYHI